MRVVVIGSGSREHGLQHALSKTAEVIVTPGRAGIPGSVSTEPEELDADLFVVGPEQPLVDGLADHLRDQGKSVLGPGADGARMERSKAWMKRLLTAAGVPTAKYGVFWRGDEREAERFLRTRMQPPYVVKTDYLAAGKGVLVTNDLNEVIVDARVKLKKGGIVIEEGLIGIERSFFALCSGSEWVSLPSAQDYKRLLDGDRGPNTGGMGAYSPVSAPSDEEIGPIFDATLAELVKRGIDYRGILYAGVMLTADGMKVLEYNIRFGDPEAQVILPRIQGDLAELLRRAAAGESPGEVSVSDEACVTVVLASPGYPEEPVTGQRIYGLEEAALVSGVTIYHSGTALDDHGRFITAGGRVLSVTATDSTIASARAWAYEAVRLIGFEGMQYRTDIALEACLR